MSTRKRVVARLSNIKVLAILVLVGLYAGAATYYILGDASVRGLTVKVFDVSRFCTNDPGITDQVANYEIHASVWSTQSLHTSLTDIQFALVTDNGHVTTTRADDTFFDPGKGAQFTLAFKDDSLNPYALPPSQNLALSITATVSAGLVKSVLTRSDSFVQEFSSTSC